MKQLGSFVGKTIKSLKADQAVKLHRLKSAWLEAVGPFLGSQTEPVSIKGDTLYLIVSSPMWAQEVNLQQRLILEKLRNRLGRPPKKISCWVGEVHARKERSETKQEDSEEGVPWKDYPLPTDRKANIEATVSTIEDSRIRTTMRKLMELSVQRELYLLEKGQLPCPVCGDFRPADVPYCRRCEREREEEEERRLMRLMAKNPWLTARQVADRFPLKDRSTFMRVRKALLANWMLQAWQRTGGLEEEEVGKALDAELRGLLLDITMLRCSLPAHSLRDKHFYFALGKRLAGGYLKEGD